MKILLFDNDKRFLVTRDVTAQNFPTVAISWCKQGLLLPDLRLCPSFKRVTASGFGFGFGFGSL